MTELCLRGPWITGSYYKDERTEESMKDGWLHTGDIVTVDSEGFICKRNSENICREVFKTSAA